MLSGENKSQLFNTPERYKDLRKLEKVLIARRLLFKKVSIMPKGQFSKIKGALCNAPIATVNISNML